MIGIVVVSHSFALGQAAADLAAEMVPADARPALKVAAGLDETTFGTDAAAIADAITAVDSPDGILVLVDLGSAILSSEMALEFVDPDVAARTTISPAPLVEGLVAAIVTASTGANLAEVAQEAQQGLIAKQDQLTDSATGTAGREPGSDAPETPASRPAGPHLDFTWTIRNPHGLHARPAAAFVSGLRGLDAVIQVSNGTTGKGPASALSLTAVQTLGLRQGDLMTATISGDQAQQAYDRLAELAQDDFGERAEAAAPATPATTAGGPPLDPTHTGRQIAIGPARQVRINPDTTGYRPGDIPTEAKRLDDAAAAVDDTLRRLEQGSTLGIYAVQQLILNDDSTRAELRQSIQQGTSAIDAVRNYFAAAADQFEALDDPYLKARAEDQRGLSRMLLRALTGQPVSPGLASGILILRELDPVTAGSVDPTSVQGIITTSGGATGHGAILAQARGFALLTGRPEAANIPDGTTVAIDPVEHTLWIDPTAEELATLHQRQAGRQSEAADAARLSQEPALTRSGRRILVEANLSSVQDAAEACAAGAEGSGLVRTEVLFGHLDHLPTAEEQAEVFIQIGQALPGQTITIRTWDPGGDKPLPFLPQDPEANPMLGERGIRAMKRLPHLLDDQLTAVLLASRTIKVRVMFPMITVPEEMVWGRARYDAVRQRTGGELAVGMMVETPAAATRACDFADLADFISFGTNDLTQYTLAVDRGNPVVAGIAQGDNQAVYDLIGLAARAFAGKPIGVCGDFASQPDAVPRLIDLGVTELSVRPPLVGVIKQAVRASA